MTAGTTVSETNDRGVVTVEAALGICSVVLTFALALAESDWASDQLLQVSSGSATLPERKATATVVPGAYVRP